MNEFSTLEGIYQHPQLNTASRQSIIAVHKLVSFEKGEAILSDGQQSNAYYCMESGLARAYAINSTGKDITTGFFSPGKVVIEVASLFLRVPTIESIEAVTACTCWKIDFANFQNLFETVPGFAEWGRTWMTNALFENKLRSLYMITDSAKDRYLRLQREQPQIIQQAPLKQVASYLGVTDTSLSRIRKEVTKAF